MTARLTKHIPGVAIPDELPVKKGNTVVCMARNIRVDDGYIVGDIDEQSTRAAMLSVERTNQRLLCVHLYS